MKIKKLTIISSIMIPISTPLFFVSCSSSFDQGFVDNFYSSITGETNWTGHEKEYASSIYDLKTFRSVFRDKLPSNDELKVKGFTIALENITPYDNLGTSNFTIYLRDLNNGKTYLPTPVKVSDDSDVKESIVSFTIDGFLESTEAENNDFQNAYNDVKDEYPLNGFGTNLFKTQDIEKNISFDNPDAAYYVAKLFDFKPATNFEVSGFQKVRIDDENKITSFIIYLKKDGKTKGPGKLITLSL